MKESERGVIVRVRYIGTSGLRSWLALFKGKGSRVGELIKPMVSN